MILQKIVVAVTVIVTAPGSWQFRMQMNVLDLQNSTQIAVQVPVTVVSDHPLVLSHYYNHLNFFHRTLHS